MVGGHWDPQDGGHPAADPAALTRTAARHFKAATGLDLSGCTQVGLNMHPAGPLGSKGMCWHLEFLCAHPLLCCRNHK